MIDPYYIYLIFPVCGAVFGAMLWFSYFKSIDILEHERIIDLMIAFGIGFLTPSLALWAYFGLEVLGFNFNGKLVNDFLYSIFGVGLVEEMAKLLGIVVAFRLLKKRINEPVDYLIFAGVLALGFSIRENFIYYNNYGSQIITGRTLISCLTHIINTSICVYGIYCYQLFNKGNRYLNPLIAIGTAVLSHGLFDFFLTQPIIGDFTPFLSTIVYLIGINFWIQMFNNAINYSPFFDYQKVAHINQLYKHMIGWYIGILGVEFCYAFYYKGFEFAAVDVFKNLMREGVLLLIVTLRISRLSIHKRRYYPVRIQSPIYITRNHDEDFKLFGIGIKIRGESVKEFRFIQYMGKDITITPVDKQRNIIGTQRTARLLKKYFLKNDVVTYVIEVDNEEINHKEIFLLKPKTSGQTNMSGYPIAQLMRYDQDLLTGQDLDTIPYKSLRSLGEVYVKDVD